jgi:hypothetical protein
LNKLAWRRLFKPLAKPAESGDGHCRSVAARLKTSGRNRSSCDQDRVCCILTSNVKAACENGAFLQALRASRFPERPCAEARKYEILRKKEMRGRRAMVREFLRHGSSAALIAAAAAICGAFLFYATEYGTIDSSSMRLRRGSRLSGAFSIACIMTITLSRTG